VHLMALALAVPIVVHLLLWRRNFFVSRAGLLALLPALVVAASGTRFWLGLLEMDANARSAQAEGTLWFASLGGRPLTAAGLDYFFGAAWTERFLGHGIGAAAMLISMLLGHALVWSGMARALLWLKRGLTDRTQRGARMEIAVLALGIWLSQTVLNVVTHTAHHPHYYNATWIAFVVFAWLALDGLSRLSRWRIASYVASAHALALGAALATVVNGLHMTAGTRSLHYGLALGEVMRVAAELGQSHPESRLATKVEQLRLFPHELMVLIWLAPVQPDSSRPLRGVMVDYASPDATDAQLRVTAQLLNENR
jgi:hypothetical protein